MFSQDSDGLRLTMAQGQSFLDHLVVTVRGGEFLELRRKS